MNKTSAQARPALRLLAALAPAWLPLALPAQDEQAGQLVPVIVVATRTPEEST
jgi:hypothetical protein